MPLMHTRSKKLRYRFHSILLKDLELDNRHITNLIYCRILYFLFIIHNVVLQFIYKFTLCSVKSIDWMTWYLDDRDVVWFNNEPWADVVHNESVQGVEFGDVDVMFHNHRHVNVHWHRHVTHCTISLQVIPLQVISLQVISLQVSK